MAKLQRLHCEVHGGYFNRVPKRGRVPTRCGGNNPACNKAEAGSESSQKTARAPQGSVSREDYPSAHTAALKRAASVPERKMQAVAGKNPSLDKGRAAKTLLEAQGWQATGKAWVAEDGSAWASVTAARGEEMLHIVWKDGEVQDQVYNLWNLDKPSANGRPNAHLPFDPDEIPDSELAKFLVGVKVTWWNKLGQKEESAVCGRETIKVTHIWTGTGDENPGARIVDFIDAEGGGYRAFRLDQLVKVG